MDILNVSFNQINKATEETAHSLVDEVIVCESELFVGQEVLNNETMPPVRLDAITFFLCESGEVSFSVDYKKISLTKGAMLSLSNSHILDSINISSNYKGFTLILSPQIMQSVISDMPNLNQMVMRQDRTKPLFQLEEDEMRLLTEIIVRIQRLLKATNHTFQSQLVNNEVQSFIFEFADIVLKKEAGNTKKEVTEQNRKEEVMLKFVQLILNHCKEQHEVTFYAEQLNMTAGNLTRILNASSGKPPIKWITDALVVEAKILLRKPGASIQQVADELHFGDHSTFGKFFKKHTGYTPVEYKNKGK